MTSICEVCGPGGPGGGCGIYAFVKNGRFTKVAGMDESPVNKGAICVMQRAFAFTYTLGDYPRPDYDQSDVIKCTQCAGCQIACKSWRELPLKMNYRRVLNLWKGCYAKVKSTSLSLCCLHCVHPACAAACPEEAIVKQADNGLHLLYYSSERH